MVDLDQHLFKICNGDDRAFGLWMKQAEPILRNSLRSFAVAVDTEAVLQETLLRSWQVAPHVESDGQPNSLLRLSLRIARNLAISETRKMRRVHYVEAEDLDRYIEQVRIVYDEPTPDPLLREVINQCKEQLPKKPKQALQARLLSKGGESDAILAERVFMRKNTFLQNFSRARKFLLLCLREQGIDLKQELL